MMPLKLVDATAFAKRCDGPVTVIIYAPKFGVHPDFLIGRTFWHVNHEQAIQLPVIYQVLNRLGVI
jgi:hypothetical protein